MQYRGRPCTFVVFLVVSLIPAAATADVVTTWNAATLDAIRLLRISPPEASRLLAVVHCAIHDAVNAITRTHEPYLVAGQIPASTSIDAAASAAAHHVLVALVPARASSFDALYATLVDGIRDSPQKARGLTWGAAVAAEILAVRRDDGASDTVSAPAVSGPGAWRPTPPAFAPYLLAQWGHVTPFALQHGSDFRPAGPPALESARYTADYDEVKALGSATSIARSDEQTLIAQFWADGAGTETPPGHWNSIAREVSDVQELSVVDNARLFALLNIALGDAAICAWDAKYEFAFWRPVTAIRHGDVDGNDDTVGDPTWTPLLVTPPFPDYVSGHSTFSGAAAVVLAWFFGSDDVGFTARSDFLPGVTREFTSFSAAAAEAALSRLYGGIHFRSANEDGLRAGMEIGAWVVEHVLTAKNRRSRR